MRGRARGREGGRDEWGKDSERERRKEGVS